MEGMWFEKLAGTYARQSAEQIELIVYGLARSVRSVLDAISEQSEDSLARRGQEPSKATSGSASSGEDESEPPELDWEPVLLPPLQQLGVQNSKGGITCSYGPFWNFLQVLEDVQAYKIRHCRKCGRLFYASRRDKWTCSPQCKAAYRQQQWRLHSPKYETARQTSKKAEQLGMMKAKELSRLSAGLREDAASTRSTAREPYFSK
jgi:hypothetical protein